DYYCETWDYTLSAALF
nr:immunoglobulin light chain junction region [Macaca mulatta]MOW05924.1 immunoglobulin light chain junction region [Macaca mulatta]MOW07754.1 immunoglobulin light chain junction region [Macaca mulatta]